MALNRNSKAEKIKPSLINKQIEQKTSTFTLLAHMKCGGGAEVREGGGGGCDSITCQLRQLGNQSIYLQSSII